MNHIKRIITATCLMLAIICSTLGGVNAQSTATLSGNTNEIKTTHEGAQYVILISVDGMGSEYVKPLLSPSPNEMTTMEKIIREGSGTLNARNDPNYAITLPNHTDMLTSRGVTGKTGHNWTKNTDPAVGQTLATNKNSYIASVFDVVHDNGLRTGLWSGKSKFSLYTTSYNSIHGADDITDDNNGRNKIDYNYISNAVSPEIMTADFIQEMTKNPYHFSFVHFHDPDTAGHSTGWSKKTNSTYAATLKSVDSQIGNIIAMIETSSTLKGKTTVIITADHGGHSNTHGDTANYLDYTIPLYVWGARVSPGADLYDLNSSSRRRPGVTENPSFSGEQPIRNGDTGNLALNLLKLGAIPESTINSLQNLSTALLKNTSFGTHGNTISEEDTDITSSTENTTRTINSYQIGAGINYYLTLLLNTFRDISHWMENIL